MKLLMSIAGLAETFLLLVTLTCPVLSEGNRKLDSMLSPKITDFKLNLHHRLEGARIRKKRNIQDAVETDDYQMRVGSYATEDLPYLSDYNLTFWIPVTYYSKNQVLVGTQDGDLLLFQLSDTDDRNGKIIAHSLGEEVSSKAVAFTYLDQQWFAILQSSSNTRWIRLYLKIGRALERRQSINLEGETDFDLVTVKNMHYLAVVTLQSSLYQPSFALYQWTRTQFDEIARRTAYGVRSITSWVLDGSLYFAVAQEMSEEGDFAIGSSIFLFNPKDEGELVFLQMLSTYGPKKVLSFFVAGSRYIIFIGRHDAVIYWWSHNQFLLWQTIKNTADASDVSILALANGEVVIAIALKEEVMFLTLEDSGHYAITYTMKFTGFDLKVLQFMYSGEAYYALTIFAASLKHHPHPIYKLTLRPYYIPSGSTLDALRQCAKDVSDMLGERQAEINNVHLDLNRVWIKDVYQDITTEITVTGVSSSYQPSILKEVTVLDQKILPDMPLPEVENSISRIKSIIEAIQHNVKNSIRKTSNENITGSKRFINSVIIPSLNMGSTNVDVSINGVTVSLVDQNALRRFGDQTFSYNQTVRDVHSQAITTRFLNGIAIADFLLLGGKQEVTGELKFSHLRSEILKVDNINTIPTGHLVTTGAPQVIKDLKSLSVLLSPIIDVHGQTNGEDLGQMFSKIVTKHGEDELSAKCILDSTVHIDGDIFITGLINGEVDVDKIALSSVTKFTPQKIKGHFEFSSLDIKENLDVADLVNGMNLSNLVTLSTEQTIHGDLNFNGISINRDLIVSYVNGFNLRETAVLQTNDPQFVEGFKTFDQILIADFIDMSEYATLDGVDPSLLVQDIVKHEEGIVTRNSSVFHNVVVLGNVLVSGEVNGRNVSNLPDNVWLRSKVQAVHVPVKITKLSAKNDVKVNVVNKFHLDTDVVHTSGEEVIRSVKSFEHKVMVNRDIRTVIGSTINGFDVISSQNEMGNYVDKGKIRGKKVIQKLEIFGDVSAHNLNKFQLTDIMRPQGYQEVTGPVEFPSVVTLIDGDLKSSYVQFKTLNSVDLKQFIKKAVSKKSPKSIVKNKHFAAIKAHDLFLHPGSTLDGSNFHKILSMVVTLNTPQQIFSEKVLLGAVDFHQPFTVLSLNGSDLSKALLGVVFKDESSRISSTKTFIGAVQSENVFVELIKGVDISLMGHNAFLKSEDTEVPLQMVFIGNVNIGHLITNQFIDDIHWNDLIFLNQDETLGPVFLSNATVLSDLLVTGLVNGCDLFQLGKRALYSHKENQLIQEEVTVGNLKVIGNLNLQNIVNKISMEDLQNKLITISGDQIVTSDVMLGPGWNIASMDVENSVNGINLAFIMKDAVKYSIPQDIEGYKQFHDLTTNMLIAKEVFLNGLLDGVNINELYNNAVQKTGLQIIEGKKIFPSLMADIATVEGHINGIRVPSDVILSTTTEHISGPMYFVPDLNLNSDLDVWGKIDGVHVDDLVKNRITLGTDQMVSSHLSFKERVKVFGALHIDGVVNDVVLDLACKIRENIPLNGFKIFNENLIVLGSLPTSAVNGYPIEGLEESILRLNEDEFVAELQVFEQSLKMTSLITDTVNSISMPQLTTEFSSNAYEFNKTRGYFEDLNSNFRRQLSSQLQKAEGQLSQFGYLILIQEINLGRTSKILNAFKYEGTSTEFSHSLVIWTSEKHCSHMLMERCCEVDIFHWMRVRKSGHLVLDSEPKLGRIYPLHNLAPVLDKDFVVWTNATNTQSKWCGSRADETMFLASFSKYGNFEDILKIRNAPSLSDIKSFRRGHLYAVAGFYYDRREGDYGTAIVYVYRELERKWSEYQMLPSFGVLCLDLAYYTNYVSKQLLLAVGTGDGSYSSIYKWNDDEYKFNLLHKVPLQYVTSTLWMKHGSAQLLVMANVKHWPKLGEDCMEVLSGGQVNIYIYENKMKWIQSIPLEGVISLVSFTLEGDTFLVAASSQLQTIFIYEWKGYEKFTQIQSMFVGEVRHMNSYTIENDLYLTVAIASGPSKVLKVVVRGNRFTSTAIRHPPHHDHQKDEAINEKSDC